MEVDELQWQQGRDCPLEGLIELKKECIQRCDLEEEDQLGRKNPAIRTMGSCLLSALALKGQGERAVPQPVGCSSRGKGGI